MTKKGKLGSIEVQLAAWVPINERYRRHYVPLTPESESVSSEQGGLVVDTKFRPWVVRDWSRGVGFDVWGRGQPGYRTASGVRAHPTKAGLILALDGTSASPTDAVSRFGFGKFQLWSGLDNSVQSWGGASWAVAVNTGAAAGQDIYSFAESKNSGDMFTSHVQAGTGDPEDPGEIWEWSIAGSAQTLHYDTTTDPFTYLPLLVSYRQRLFALDGADLYEVDQDVADTRTLVAQTGMSPTHVSGGYRTQHRLAASDKGPIWLAQDGDGAIYVWEYDVAADEQRIVGKIPGSFFVPYDIAFVRGFYMVAFRAVAQDYLGTQPSPALVWFKRGGQDGVIGPVPESSLTSSTAIRLAGVIGSELILCIGSIAWGYDFDAGGLVEYAATPAMHDAVVYGSELWVAPSSGAEERFTGLVYQASGTVHLGWHDWDYPGLVKEFLDVTVLTEPLPAGTSVTVAVAVDGSTTYTALTGTHDVDGATAFTFTVPNPTSAPIQGNRFEVRLTLATSNTANTPTVIEVSARATGAQSVLEVIWQIDAGTVDGQADEVLIAALNGLKTAGNPITVEDPWQKRETSDPETYVATVEDLQTPSTEDPVDGDEHPVAVVKLRQRALV